MNQVPARVSSFLPSIKCSNCNADIPISQMGGHICSQGAATTPAVPATRLNILDGPFAPEKTPAIPPRRDQPPAPRLETSGSDTSSSSVRLPFTSMSPSESSSRSVSPIQSMAGRRSPYQFPSRSQTTPLPSRPPSDEMAMAQDNPFPVFNSNRSRCATPVALMDVKPSLPRTQTAPVRPQRSNNNADLADGRLDGEQSGLRGGGREAASLSNDIKPLNEATRALRHSKSPSLASSKDLSSRPTSVGTARFHMPRPSASSSVYTRNRSMSTFSGNSRLEWDSPDIPSIPSMSEKRSQTQRSEPNVSPQLDNSFDFGLNQSSEEHSAPREEPPEQNPPPQPSPYVHKPRPSVTAAMAPLDSIGSSSSFKPSRSMRGRKASVAATASPLSLNSNPDARDDKRLQDAPPVPQTLCPQEPSPLSHTPNESTSSNGSYSSGVRSGSSRSSPPLQESPRKQGRHAFGNPDAENSFQAFQFGVDTSEPAREPTPQENAYASSPDTQRPQYPSRPPSPSVEPTLPNIMPPPSPLPRHDSPISNSPDDYMITSSFDSPTDSNQFHLAPNPPASPPRPANPPQQPRVPPQRPGPRDKGPCRGCGEPIFGKSVSSADGRLTGRYHKGCFVCTTCANPFQTADFYVIRNHPYCGRHYHELNNSLCQGCNRGIEGQYLETETYRKFHSYCFTCQECHKILRDDYFEWRGRTLCEQHAFKAANQPSSSLGIGGGGRRYPERRTTKLMMMM